MMKKLFFSLLTMIYAAMPLAAQDDYNSQIDYISGSGNNVVLMVTAQADDKKQVEVVAGKSVVSAFLFHGIQGVGTGEPVIDEQTRRLNNDYFLSLFRARYTVYIANIQKIAGPKKNAVGVFEGTYQLVFKQDALMQNLYSNEILQRPGPPKAQLPSIMVVPYRRQGESFRSILDRNPYIRMAINKVQSEFAQAGYPTVDFIAKFDETERHNQFTSDNADSFASQLIRNSGSDIYVTVDFNVEKGYSQNDVSLALKSYYTSSGSVIAAVNSSYKGSTTVDRCCVGAIHKVKNEFLRMIKWPPTNVETRLTIGVSGESSLSLHDMAGNTGQTIIMLVRNWVKNNVKEYHQQGFSDTELIFDRVTLPKALDSTDFAMNLIQYLKTKGISATPTIDGQSIYITLTD